MEIFEEFRRRCQAAGLELEELDRDDAYGLMRMLLIQFPQGRTTREVEIYVGEEAFVRWFLREEFEAYAYLQEFEASWSAQHRVIECNLVDAASNSLLSTHGSWAFGKVTNVLGLEPSSVFEPEERLRFPSVDGLEVSLGSSSNMHTIHGSSSSLRTKG